jgi:hypothetical protein
MCPVDTTRLLRALISLVSHVPALPPVQRKLRKRNPVSRILEVVPNKAKSNTVLQHPSSQDLISQTAKCHSLPDYIKLLRARVTNNKYSLTPVRQPSVSVSI